MEFLDLIASHRSIRRFRPDPVPDDDFAAILEAATRASSNGNMQTYSMIVTRDPERKARLCELHFGQEHILQAPALITFIVDWHRMNRWCRLSGTEPGYDNLLSFLVGFADTLVAAQNAACAAEALGYGICYLGTTLSASTKIADFLALPESVFPAITLVIGRPDENPSVRARLPREGIVHEECYHRPSDDEVRATYRNRETEGWARYMKVPFLAERIRSSGARNLAEVYTNVKYTKENNERFSAEISALLQAKGFLPKT